MPRSFAAITIHLFGISAFIAGTLTTISPAITASNLSLPAIPGTLESVQANGLAAIAMGIYYNIAGYQENRTFMIATVPMRLLTTMVFLKSAAQAGDVDGGGWMTAGLWEGLGALATAIALWADSKAKTKNRKSSP
ncbi:hypothetical protein TWF694_005095 [Orbilia ellipsospora]|uniref:Uncharacterized protein n=1 Tax=Orbilia ellipsospora TaxID=2528407 RepID=A0AAV9WUP3_9PEZI